MVLLRHREILDDGTILIAQTDPKSHDKDPDPNNRKAYRIVKIVSHFFNLLVRTERKRPCLGFTLWT